MGRKLVSMLLMASYAVVEYKALHWFCSYWYYSFLKHSNSVFSLWVCSALYQIPVVVKHLLAKWSLQSSGFFYLLIVLEAIAGGSTVTSTCLFYDERLAIPWSVQMHNGKTFSLSRANTLLIFTRFSKSSPISCIVTIRNKQSPFSFLLPLCSSSIRFDWRALYLRGR